MYASECVRQHKESMQLPFDSIVSTQQHVHPALYNGTIPVWREICTQISALCFNFVCCSALIYFHYYLEYLLADFVSVYLAILRNIMLVWLENSNSESQVCVQCRPFRVLG